MPYLVWVITLQKDGTCKRSEAPVGYLDHDVLHYSLEQFRQRARREFKLAAHQFPHLESNRRRVRQVNRYIEVQAKKGYKVSFSDAYLAITTKGRK